MEFKEQPVKTAFGHILKIAYYAFCALWLSFPLWFTAIVVPDTTGFLLELGQKLPLLTTALIKYSFVCGAIGTFINIGFSIWHLFVKRHRSSVFKNKLFFWWVLTINVALVIWCVVGIFGVNTNGLPKMGN